MKLMSILGFGVKEAVARNCAECSQLRQRVQDEVALLIKVADGLERNIDACIFGAPLSKRGWRRTKARTRDLRRIRRVVLVRLELLGVKRMAATGRFGPRRHDIDVFLNCQRQADDGRLGSVYSHGYETVGGAVVRRALVSVWLYSPPIPPDRRFPDSRE